MEAENCPRRRFIRMAAGCMLCGVAGTRNLTAQSHLRVDVGTRGDYPRDIISEKFVQHDLFVIRHKGRLFACTAICPHRTNVLLVDPKNPAQIICAGHDAVFTPEGLPERGPTKRPLVRYGVSVEGDGRIIVDKSREFQKARWSDRASFIPLGAAQDSGAGGRKAGGETAGGPA